jgi:hypothetical protein
MFFANVMRCLDFRLNIRAATAIFTGYSSIFFLKKTSSGTILTPLSDTPYPLE